MIEAKDITVAVPCLFKDTQPIWMMMESCSKLNIPVIPYGIGDTYNGWTDIKIYKLRDLAANWPTSHILYTDARDAWFLGDMNEVAEKYNAYGAPPLMLSAQPDIFMTYEKWYPKIPWNMDHRFRYVGTPGQLCEAKALADALTWMISNFHLGEDENGLPDDDPAWWIEYMAAHPGQVVLEHKCDIFMNAGSYMEEGMWDACLEIDGNRVHNKITDSLPCVLHFNGGASHALYGKWERLEYYWRALGNTSNPPWVHP